MTGTHAALRLAQLKSCLTFPLLKAMKAMKAMKTRATMKAMPKAKPKAKPKLYKAFTGAVRLRRRVLEMKANYYKCGV